MKRKPMRNPKLERKRPNDLLDIFPKWLFVGTVVFLIRIAILFDALSRNAFGNARNLTPSDDLLNGNHFVLSTFG